MTEVQSVIDIDAPPDIVWRTFSDFGRYREWNPFIRKARGTVSIGGHVRVHVQPSIRLPFPVTFRAMVTASQQARELRWVGHVLAPWIGSGDHSFTLEPLGPTRTRFTQHEVFTGVLPRLFKKLLLRETRRGFDAMNFALKKHVEKKAEENAPIAQERASCVPA